MRGDWKHFSHLFRGSYRTLMWCVPFSVLQSLLLVPIPLIVRHLFENVVPRDNLKSLAWIGSILLLFYIAEAFLTLKLRSTIQKLIKGKIQLLREELIWKFYSLPQTYISQIEQSKLHTVITQDTERVDAMSHAVFSHFLPALLTAAGLSVVLLVLNPFLFVVTILFLPILFWFSRILNARVRIAAQKFHRSFEWFNKGVLFVLQNVSLTRNQAAEQSEFQRQKEILSRLNLESSAMAWLRTAHHVVQNLVAGATMIVILIAGGIAVIQDWITLGELLSFYVAVALWRNALSTASQSIPQILEGSESLKTINSFLQLDLKQPYAGTRQTDFTGTLAMEHIHFSFSDSPFLQNISMTMSPGEIVALTGPNGSGKTTVANLILGLYRPKQGQLKADEIPYEDLDLTHLRKYFGIVAQDPLPFHGTILENITYGNDSVSLESVQSASKLAGAHRFIANLPDQYNTIIGEQGINLSGGERQLIAIARAVLRKPRLLILDEPTKHLDRASIQNLIPSLQQLSPAPSVLLITHESDIILIADRIFMLQEGTLIATDAVHASR